MKRSYRAAKSVAKFLSPLILSFIAVLSAFLLVKSVGGSTLSAASRFISSEPTVPAYTGRNLLEGYEAPPAKEPATAEEPAATDEETEGDFIDLNDIVFPKTGDLYARLSIASCGIEDDVYFDDTNEVLRLGLGQYTGSRIPGYGEPILIAGHNNRTFHRLGEANVGDIVTITTNYGVFEYEITKTEILKASDEKIRSMVNEKDHEILMLYTCYPFTTLSLTTQRYFVYAEKVSGPVLLY